jgi:hypothetical protein
MWAAIRAGWREGYSAESEPLALESREASEAAILLEPGYTKFVMEAGALASNPAACAEAIGGLCDFIQKARSPQPSWRRFDLEVSFQNPVEPSAVGSLLDELKEQGRSAQSIAPKLQRADQIEPLYAVAKRHGAVLKLNVDQGTPIDWLREAGSVASGRVQCRLARGIDMRTIAEALRG